MKRAKILMGAVLLCLCLAGCGEPETIPVSVDEPLPDSQTVVITCAGDCTLGTDAAFGGITLPKELELQGGDYSYFLRNVLPYFAGDDLTMVNLEGTLTDRGVRLDKTYAFRGAPDYTQILTQGSVEAVTLANNHSLDYGDVSMQDTKRYLDEAGIHWVEGLHTKVATFSDVKVGMVGLNALSSAAANQLPKAMAQVKDAGAELILVQFHWGIEGEHYPTQGQIALAHQAVDLGADLVIGHHPHVLQGLEQYKGRMIVYSLGNFCFGGNQNPRDKDTMIYRQTFTLGESGVTDWNNYCVIPCSISSTPERNNYQPTPVYGEEGRRIKEKIQTFSNQLGAIRIRFQSDIY
ncbi:MAG: CapA family protein [Clostridia bacterium]|nr:CapA family protein [Clostridia bacterium]